MALNGGVNFLDIASVTFNAEFVYLEVSVADMLRLSVFFRETALFNSNFV